MTESFLSLMPTEITVLVSAKGHSPGFDSITAYMSRSVHFCMLHYRGLPYKRQTGPFYRQFFRLQKNKKTSRVRIHHRQNQVFSVISFQ